MSPPTVGLSPLLCTVWVASLAPADGARVEWSCCNRRCGTVGAQGVLAWSEGNMAEGGPESGLVQKPCCHHYCLVLGSHRQGH